MTDRPDRQRLFLSPPHMSGLETEFVRQAFESNYIAPLGPMVDAFEKEFCEKMRIPYAVAVSSGTAAMHLAMRSLGIGPGDEVFVSNLTFIGSVTPVLFEGAVPVFIDSDRETWNMDLDLLAGELARRNKAGMLPKAVVPTDLFGQCCHVGQLVEICEPYGIPVIVDSAEAVGATWNGCSAGAGAKAAVYSFNGNKIITTSGGGMLASEDREFIEQARFLSQQARDPFPHYEHSQIGYNYRMSNIVAAIGRGQLRVLDDRVKRKREIFEYYKTALGDLPGIEFMPEAEYGKSNRWLTVILIDKEKFGADRGTIRFVLEMENIESRPVWMPMHMQPVFEVEKQAMEKQAMEKQAMEKQAIEKQAIEKQAIGEGREARGDGSKPKNGRYRARLVGGEVSEDLFTRGLCLPSGTQMTEEDLDRVVKVIRKCCRG